MGMIAGLVLLSIGFGAALIWLVQQLGSANIRLPLTASWVEELSTERYRPMMRLLNADDRQFVESQRGLPPGTTRAFREERCRVFRGYLRCLYLDFRRVSMAIRILLAQARDDRPDLAAVLIRRRMAFAAGMAVVHLRMILYRWGIGGVDVVALVHSFDDLMRELRALLPRAATIEA